MDALNAVIIGHVDHGKSSFIGRLLYDLGCLSHEQMERLNILGNENGELEFAHIMDSFEEERLFGMTMDTSNISFKHGERQYVIIDVPGHYELLAKMVTGAHCADAALLVIDVREGLQRQTKLHCRLLHMLNIKEIVVLVNKMDLANFGREEFDRVRADTVSFLESINMEPRHVIPVSASSGDNIAAASANMPWYGGPTAASALNSLTAKTQILREVCFPVQDVYEFDGEKIIAGRIESGSIFPGQRLMMFPDRAYYSVKEIKKFGKPGIERADEGECVGLVFGEKDLTAIKRGAVFTDSDDFRVGARLKGRVFWISGEPCAVGSRYSICCATQAAPGRVTGISNRVHVSVDGEIECLESADNLSLGEIADIEIDSDRSLVFQTANSSKLSNFVMKKDDVLIAGGGSFHD